MRGTPVRASTLPDDPELARCLFASHHLFEAEWLLGGQQRLLNGLLPVGQGAHHVHAAAADVEDALLMEQGQPLIGLVG
jgi:hypothetical protein